MTALSLSLISYNPRVRSLAFMSLFVCVCWQVVQLQLFTKAFEDKHENLTAAIHVDELLWAQLQNRGILTAQQLAECQSCVRYHRLSCKYPKQSIHVLKYTFGCNARDTDYVELVWTWSVGLFSQNLDIEQYNKGRTFACVAVKFGTKQILKDYIIICPMH